MPYGVNHKGKWKRRVALLFTPLLIYIAVLFRLTLFIPQPFRNVFYSSLGGVLQVEEVCKLSIFYGGQHILWETTSKAEIAEILDYITYFPYYAIQYAPPHLQGSSEIPVLQIDTYSHGVISYQMTNESFEIFDRCYFGEKNYFQPLLDLVDYP